MSDANIELVTGLIADADVDLAALVRDDAMWAAATAALAERLHPNFEFVTRSPPRDETPYPGLDGLRRGFMDWFAPWAIYRVATERAIDRGDRVVLLNVEYCRLQPGGAEVKLETASVWTVRDGKVIRVETYPDRAHALAAVDAPGT